jgi:hypothetical protein
MRTRFLTTILTSLTFLVTGSSLAQTRYGGPPGWLSATANQKIWKKYCTGTAAGTAIPGVNYSNELVRSAAAKLSKVWNTSFYFYGPILKVYGLQASAGKLVAPPANAPAGTTSNAHAFLVQLCGEFRDRAAMVEAKIRWVNNLFLLPRGPQRPIDPRYNLWSQVAAVSYRPYLNFSSALFSAKRQAAGPALTIGPYTVDPPVEPQTVCETKFIFANYVAKGIPFDGNLQAFKQALAAWAPTNCTQAELDSYYDFRGDSNFKPQSPESNGMIWYSTSIAAHCASPAKAKDAKLKDTDCANYFRYPFFNRWNAARAGLAAWLLRDSKYDSIFAGTGQRVTILPHREGYLRPFAFQVGSDPAPKSEFLPAWTAYPAGWAAGDIGFNRAVSADGRLAYERLRDAVNRHTDWYSSGFNDGMGMNRSQAYSPFVASSYEMSKSDSFTSPGTTVSSPSDGFKHWMFIFRVHKSAWYNSYSVQQRVPVDFDRHWLDETSLGTVSLAKAERAWDRLGTALEGELDSIVYLHNIRTSGEVLP